MLLLYISGCLVCWWIEEVCELIVDKLGVCLFEVIFIVGGIESDNLVVKGIYWVCCDVELYCCCIVIIEVEYYVVLDLVNWFVEYEGVYVIWLLIVVDGLVLVIVLCEVL